MNKAIMAKVFKPYRKRLLRQKIMIFVRAPRTEMRKRIRLRMIRPMTETVNSGRKNRTNKARNRPTIPRTAAGFLNKDSKEKIPSTYLHLLDSNDRRVKKRKTITRLRT